MPKAIRLPAAIPEDEMRMTYEPEGLIGKPDLLISGGHRRLQNLLLTTFGSPRTCVDSLKLAGVIGLGDMRNFITQEPPLIEEIKAAGYDPLSLVLSIQRPAETNAKDVPEDDEDDQTKIENAQEKAVILLAQIDLWQSVHDLTVLSDSELRNLTETIETIRDLLGSVLERRSQ